MPKPTLNMDEAVKLLRAYTVAVTRSAHSNGQTHGRAMDQGAAKLLRELTGEKPTPEQVREATA